jgi:hypothetical protein
MMDTVYTSYADMTGETLSFSDTYEVIRKLSDIDQLRCFAFRKYNKGDIQIEREYDGAFNIYLPCDEYDIQQIADILVLIKSMRID